MTVAQTAFRAALLDPRAAIPAGLSDPQSRPAGKRFDVYRNNLAVSLTEALAAGFPVLARLLGEENFRGLAGMFLRAHPPKSPVLMHYGDEMPAFLGSLAQLAHLPYLADVARLELAMRSAYHAADAAPADPSGLAALSPEALISTRLALAPPVRTLASRWPVLGIWRRNSEADAPRPAMAPEEVLVVRPDFDPLPVALPPGGAAFIEALAAGHAIGAAHDAAAHVDGFDATPCLSALIAGNAITRIEAPR